MRSVFLSCTYNINYSAPTNGLLVRFECVVREYPPQTTTSELGDEIVDVIMQLVPAQMFAVSGEKRL